MKETKILVAGFGGQGIVLLGRLIAYGGMLDNRTVTCFPSYGAEMRGGTANCTVIVSDDIIGSPVVQNPDIVIAMNDASLRRFLSRVSSKGLLLYDSTLIKSPIMRSDVRSIGVPASEIAASLNGTRPSGKAGPLSATQVRSANMVMLGALIAATGILSEDNAVQALEQLTATKKRKAFEANREAIRRGIKFIADTKSTD